MIEMLNQNAVSHDPLINAELSDAQRLLNLETDIITVLTVMSSVVSQNNKYAEYLQARINREEQSLKFWQDVKTRIAVSGIWGFIVLLGSAVIFAAKEWLTA